MLLLRRALTMVAVAVAVYAIGLGVYALLRWA
jgi:hypothetical protein